MIIKQLEINGHLFINVPADIKTLMELGVSNQKALELIAETEQKAKFERVLQQRIYAYKNESDPLYMEYQYDKTSESEKKWRDKVTEIKTCYPLPEVS